MQKFIFIDFIDIKLQFVIHSFFVAFKTIHVVVGFSLDDFAKNNQSGINACMHHQFLHGITRRFEPEYDTLRIYIWLHGHNHTMIAQYAGHQRIGWKTIELKYKTTMLVGYS